MVYCVILQCRKETPEVKSLGIEMATQAKNGYLTNEDLFNVDLQFFNVSPKALAQSNNFKNHIKTHSKKKLYSCEVCHKQLGSLSFLKNHGRLHSEEKRHKCEFCGKAFANVFSLSTHVRVHTGEKPFKCKLCNKAFTQVANLNHHVRIHTGEKPYKCQICNKAFVQVTQLNNHNRTHTGEKPFTCKLCGKSFIQVANLNDHVIIHTGYKPYKCPICNKAFIRITQLNNHNRTHTGEKPFKCALCGKAFTQASSLKQHLKTHPIVEPSKFDTAIDHFSFLNKHCAAQSIKQLKIGKICGKVFQNDYELRKHKRTDAAKKAAACMQIENSRPTEHTWQEADLLSDYFLHNDGNTLHDDHCLDRIETPDVVSWESEMAILTKSEHLRSENVFNVDLELFVVRPFGCGICNEMFESEENFILHCKQCDALLKDILGEQFERHLFNQTRR